MSGLDAGFARRVALRANALQRGRFPVSLPLAGLLVGVLLGLVLNVKMRRFVNV